MPFVCVGSRGGGGLSRAEVEFISFVVGYYNTEILKNTTSRRNKHTLVTSYYTPYWDIDSYLGT